MNILCILLLNYDEPSWNGYPLYYIYSSSCPILCPSPYTTHNLIGQIIITWFRVIILILPHLMMMLMMILLRMMMTSRSTRFPFPAGGVAFFILVHVHYVVICPGMFCWIFMKIRFGDEPENSIPCPQAKNVQPSKRSHALAQSQSQTQYPISVLLCVTHRNRPILIIRVPNMSRSLPGAAGWLDGQHK